jgi:hypothetical protein
MALAKTMPRIVEGGCRVWMVIVNGESAAETPLILSAQSGLVYVGRGPRRQRTGSPWQYNDWRFRRAFVRLSKLHGVDARLALDGPCRPRLHNASAGGKTGMAGLPIALFTPCMPYDMYMWIPFSFYPLIKERRNTLRFPSRSSRSLHASLISHVISL